MIADFGLDATNCSHPQSNSVAYGQAHGRGMSVSGKQWERRGAEVLKLYLSALPPADWHPSGVSLALHHIWRTFLLSMSMIKKLCFAQLWNILEYVCCVVGI